MSFLPTWEQPIGVDASGAIAEGTADWLLAEYGDPDGAGRDSPSPVPEAEWLSAILTELPPLLTAEEAASLLRTSRRNLQRWIASGRLRAIAGGVGGSSRVLVPRTEIARFLASLAP
jgi:excisionase family DNA binding protein